MLQRVAACCSVLQRVISFSYDHLEVMSSRDDVIEMMSSRDDENTQVFVFVFFETTRGIQCRHRILEMTNTERWGAEVEYHFQEI